MTVSFLDPSLVDELTYLVPEAEMEDWLGDVAAYLVLEAAVEGIGFSLLVFEFIESPPVTITCFS